MIKYALVFFLSILLGCGSKKSTNFNKTKHEYDNYDNANISKSEYLDVLSGSKHNSNKNKKTSSLRKTKLMITPKKPSDIPDKIISISVTEDVPLKEVLLEIGRMANLDIQISPKIDSYIIFTAKNKPLVDVLNSITEIASVRYKIKNGIVLFEPDESYVETYNIHFLNITRNATSSKSVSSSVSGGGSSGGSNSSSSSFSLQTKSEDKMWDDLVIGLNQIVSEESLNEKKLEEAKKKKELAGSLVPQQNKADLANPAPGQVTSAVNNLSDRVNNALIPAAPTAPQPPTLPPPSAQQNSQQNQSNQQSGQNAMGKDAISINKQGGIIAVYANKKAHAKIDAYLNLLHKKIMSQVLIEVKILEVTLDDQYLNGIDWGAVSTMIGDAALSFATGFATYGASAVATSAVTSAAMLKISGSNAATNVISALNNFGTVRTVISPRLNATNNQQAVLSRAQNDVYFNMTITNNFVNGASGLTVGGTNNLTNSAAQQFSISATPQTIANGVNLTVQPSIDFEKREITMNVRPMISGIVSSVQDPAFAYIVAQSVTTAGKSNATNGLQNNIPVTVSKEFDTIVKVKDGEMMIMGGFTQNIKTIRESGFPFLSDIPWLGLLFKTKSSVESIVETVLLIKATIVDDGEDNLHDADKELYNKMAYYPRKQYL